jgi:quinol monooxygenase YgiN
MVKLALWVPLEARPGKEKEAEQFLLDGLSLVEQEAGTTAWFALRLGPSTFGIFDAFPDEASRDAHLAGKVAAALMAKAPDLFNGPPSIQKLEILAAKLP